MDVVSWLLSRAYVNKTLVGMGALKGAPAMISGISDNPDGTHNITFSWKDNNNVTHTSVLTVKDGQTPSIASVPIANGHRVTFATTNPSQSVTFDVMNGNNGQQGISVVGSNVDTYNHLTFTLSNGNTIDAGYINAVTNVDNVLSSVSTNPVQNKVIKEALDTKQDIVQYSTMPSAQDNLGKIVQYIGTNTANYTNGYFYKAIYDSTSDVYVWSVIKFSADMLVDNALSTTSENPVQNKVITGAINNIQGVIPSEASSTNQLVDRDSLGTASQKNFTPYVSPDNTDVPLSSSVYSAITSAVYGAYHPSGSKTIAELTSDLLVFANIGNVYKITEDGVTTNLFVGGAGQTIHTGDNAVVVYGGQPNTFLFDLQSGSIDLTPYQTKALGSAVEGKTTVEGALGALSTNKATQTEVNDIVNVLGAKNLLPNLGLATSTDNGITYTKQSDGSVIANGTASNWAYYNLCTSFPLEAGTYIISGKLEKDGTQIKLLNADTSTDIVIVNNLQTERTFTLANTTNIHAMLYIGTAAGAVSNFAFKPMIRLASDPDNTYVPYAMTNRKLTEKIDIVGNLFTTTTKVVDNITHGIATTVATLENLPIGTYVVSGQFNSDSAMSGGGLVQFASSGVIQNGANCNTMINQGFKANAGLTGIFNVTNATNQINLQIYTATADLPVSSARLAAIRIA